MNVRQKKIQSSISGLLSQKKIQEFGVYSDLIADTNTNVWDGTKGWRSPRRWHRKSWLFLGAASEDVIVGAAIVDAGFIAKAFCYVYFPKTGELLEDGIDRPFAFEANFDANINSHWKLGNYEIKYTGKQLKFQFKGKKFQLTLENTNNNNGLSFICPSKGKKRPFHFTYKNLLLPTKITVTQKGKTQQFDQIYGSLDFSKGYPPKHTQWNWTSFMGNLEDGTPVGINVVDQFNQNMENAVWIGTESQLLGDMRYTYQKPLAKSLWKVEAVDGNLELEMQPNGSRKENIDVKVLKSKFTQVYGEITGKILYQGTWKALKGYGVMEEHEAIW